MVTKWTAEEDSVLVEAVVAAGSRICWNTIAGRLPGRSNKSCRKRWIHSLDPSLRKGRWTTSEDALLITAVRRHGRHWYKVAELLPGRTDDQCAKRWREKLDPSIRRDPWTQAEDLKLLEALGKHEKRWNVISGCIKGRPAVQCRNRFLSLQRAGKVSEDGKSSVSTTASCGPISDAEIIQCNELSDRAAIDIGAQPELLTSSTLSAGSSLSLSSCPSSPSSGSSAEPSLSMWDTISAASSSPPMSIASLEPTRISTEPQGFPMSLGFVDADFFNAQNFNLDDTKCAGTPLTFPALGLAEHPFSWGEDLIIPTDGVITTSQTIQDPSMLLTQELVQRSSTHSPVVFSQENGTSFVMTCPLPLCSHQFNELISIWRHITWDHLGDPNICSKVMTELVEKVVLGTVEE